jgi:hypothetical protein
MLQTLYPLWRALLAPESYLPISVWCLADSSLFR